jgi:TrmH family RNA methyltransferase
MEIIRSRDNNKIKYLKKLSLKKYREETGEFKVESIVTIKDAWSAGYKFKELFVTESFLAKAVLKDLNFLADIPNINLNVIDDVLNAVFSDLDTPAGLCAVYSAPRADFGCEASVVYLNNISDPGNLGTILRSACAFNLKNIIIDEYSVDLYNSKTIQAARESIFKLNIGFDREKKFLKKIKGKMPICATSLTGDSRCEEIIDAGAKICVVLGSESHGVDSEIIALADFLYKIELPGEMESLNVASAAAIIFYLMNRRIKAN